MRTRPITVALAAIGVLAAVGLSTPIAAAAADPVAPTVRATATVTSDPATGAWKLTLDASATTPGSSPIVSYTFSFQGPDTPVTQSSPVATEVYPAPGRYGWGVQATDANGLVGGAGEVTTVGSRYQPVGPVRVLDTRVATGVATRTPVPAHGTVDLALAGHAGVPATGVVAAVLNVTVTAPTTTGTLTVFPHGQPRPVASNLNWTAGQTIPNLVTVPVVDGSVSFYNNSPGTAHLVADLAGYYTVDEASRYAPLTPVRVLDTRNATGVGTRTPMPALGTVVLPVTNRNGVPATGVSAVVLNVTVTAPTTAGVLTVYPDGTTRPLASNLNWTAGQTIANLVTVPVVDGKVAFYNNSPGTVHVVSDLAGYYTATGDGNLLSPDGPFRVLDTRTGLGVPATFVTPIPAEQTMIVQIGGVHGVPTTLVHGVVMNVTVTGGTSSGVLTVYSNGASRPTVSNLNWSAGQTIANLVVLSTVDVPGLGTSVIVYNHSPGSVHVVIDVVGFFAGF